MNEGESLCARCAALQRTCCQHRDIYVTLQDVNRIARFAGRVEFWEFRIPENPDYFDAVDDPLWIERVVRLDHSRRVLKQQPNGDCCFLGAAGCFLPLEVRPLVCRLHPCDYDERGIKPELAAECPWEVLPPGESKLFAVRLSAADADRWHRQLYEEIRQEPKWAGAEWHTSPDSVKPAAVALYPAPDRALHS